jgi:hypothetical protein
VSRSIVVLASATPQVNIVAIMVAIATYLVFIFSSQKLKFPLCLLQKVETIAMIGK